LFPRIFVVNVFIQQRWQQSLTEVLWIYVILYWPASHLQEGPSHEP
jgi:hypothetical protein